MLEYGEIIRNALKASGISKKELCEKAFVGRSTLYNMENEIKTSNLSTFESVLDVLGYELVIRKKG